VEMHCSYTYPPTIVDRVKKKFWFTKESNNVYVDLKTDPEYSGRVHYHSENKDCFLRISDLRERDSAVYYFRFITDDLTGKYTGLPGVTLSVTGNVSRFYTSSKWAELKCQSSCHLPYHTSYVWYKNGLNIPLRTSDSYSAYIYPADSYSCAVRGHEDSRSPSVYAPKLPSVTVSPSGDLMEGSSVNVTCNSDANPAAKYTWYKENLVPNPVLERLSEGSQLVFSSIQSSDSGQYYCTAENMLGRTSANISINVKYAPKLPYVSVSPSAEIVEGSSVNLTCSSDANPAANYTWYKENQTLLQGPEGNYYFLSISYKDSGNYHCKSENQHGLINSSSLSIDVQCKSLFLMMQKSYLIMHDNINGICLHTYCLLA
uniref:B-cell receptor CD22 n=1 Tax=Sander lucioperca TaxID=283035 RepID=A0A8C9XRT6_SANLU